MATNRRLVVKQDDMDIALAPKTALALVQKPPVGKKMEK